MSDTAIRVHNLAKGYHIGRKEPYPTLRAALAKSFASGIQRLKQSARSAGTNGNGSDRQSAFIWALKDISFEIKKGETVGIVGLNGSGKSTLLKLLAQITEPTHGEIYINGRITALIELGAGFHPELTGRENIYLSGAILGLSKKQVDAKFDEIVDFAELSDFIDTPVKHYSSGMYIRLGFSVAVSIDPEILLVDEVLAVGDAAFRKRCFERIDAFIKAGKTLIIVTHSLEEVKRLAHRAILIDHGSVKASGSPEEVIARYTALVAEKTIAAQKWNENSAR
jgi:lipopolysaccharide transport system ATP-binding protein